MALALEGTPCHLKGNIQRPSGFAKGLRVGDNALQAAHGEYDATVKMGRVCFDSLGRESGPTVRPASQLPGMTPPEERRHDGRWGWLYDGYDRRIFSMARPRASSSTNLSR